MVKHVGESTSQTLSNKTLGSDLNAGGYKITNLAAPVNDNDVARKIDVSAVGKWQVVYETTLNSDLAYIDITGLDINTDKEYKLTVITRNTSSNNLHYFMYVNNDYTNSNYYAQSLSADGTSVAALRDNYPNLMTSWGNANVYCNANLIRDISGYPRAIIEEANRSGNSISYVSYAWTKTATVTNITSIRLSSQSGNNFSAGTYILICKPRG